MWQRSREYAAARKAYKERLRTLSPAEREHHDACEAVDRDIAQISARLADAQSNVLASFAGRVPGTFVEGIFVTEETVFVPGTTFPLEPGLEITLVEGGQAHAYAMNRSPGGTSLRRGAAHMVMPGAGFFVKDQKVRTFDNRELALAFDSDTWAHVQHVNPDHRIEAVTFISQVTNVPKNLSGLRQERDRVVAHLTAELEEVQNFRRSLGEDPCPRPVRRRAERPAV
jgi:hypothetical protein